MPNLGDNLRAWREAARIDWFSQFIKAWIPFNAWMTDNYGDLSDRELLDKVKAGSNVVFNRMVPMLTPNLRPSRDVAREDRGWQNSTLEAEELRQNISELNRLLQGCVIEGRRGRVSFETVDIGGNSNRDEQLTKRTRLFRVRRDHPNKGEVTLEISASATRRAFLFTQLEHDRRELENEPTFQQLPADHRTTLLAMHEAVTPRKVLSVLAMHGHRDPLHVGETDFIDDPKKIFSALVDIVYNLRNALFHGSITPNDQHNEIYEPAYHIVMRFVRCTI